MKLLIQSKTLPNVEIASIEDAGNDAWIITLRDVAPREMPVSAPEARVFEQHDPSPLPVILAEVTGRIDPFGRPITDEEFAEQERKNAEALASANAEAAARALAESDLLPLSAETVAPVEDVSEAPASEEAPLPDDS